MSQVEFENELTELINRHSMEGASNTPDHLLTKYIIGCMSVYASTANCRDDWYGVGVKIGDVAETQSSVNHSESPTTLEILSHIFSNESAMKEGVKVEIVAVGKICKTNVTIGDKQV